MKLCINDPVIVLTGKDRGKEGNILKVDRKNNLVTISGINKKIRNVKPREGMEGGRVEIFAPISASNVAYKDPKSGKPTKLGFTMDNGKKVRIAKKSGTKVPPTGNGKFTSVIKAD